LRTSNREVHNLSVSSELSSLASVIKHSIDLFRSICRTFFGSSALA
jgi:hypothetical protein